ncbi:uncharacterized protein [Rutidosis leptorrhynchoides]|uniref:uncharacterized protein n=1 Tax=Rutidosis leptorrhynchoides TaxID=125765 RepID=UPI003A98D428
MEGVSQPSTSTVWHNIIVTGAIIEDMHLSFKSSFVKTIGDGESTSFWQEHWIGNDKLCNVFPRLYRLETNKTASIKDRISLSGSNGVQVHPWSWVRGLFGRAAGDRERLELLLSSFEFYGTAADSWSWAYASNGLFSVKKLSTLIDEQYLFQFSSNPETILNNIVPKKIEIFIWRTLKKWILVRVELDKRGIDLHSVRCPLCDDDIESVDHSVIFCKHAMEVWDRVFKWWNQGNFSSFSLAELLIDDGANSISPFGKKIWQALRWICAYLLWKNRNNKVFYDKYWTAQVTLNEIQVKSFEWLNSR